MKPIHQLVAGFSLNDAISNESLALRDLFRSWGAESQIIAPRRRIHPDLRYDVTEFETYREQPGQDDIVLLHLSTGSEVNEQFKGLPGRKIIRYHNITPPKYFRAGFEPIARELEEGLEQVKGLAGCADLNWAVSDFNAGELAALGFADVRTIPLMLNFDVLREADQALVKKYRDGLVNILFVGRGAPNKFIEDLLHAFYFFQKYVEPKSRLIHVGSYDVTRKYYDYLLTLARKLGIRNFVPAGSVGQDKLNAYYQCADLFLCMSEHEGFCIPVVEAMANEIPVAAYDAAAIPETLDGAGLLFKEKAFDQIAEVMGRLVNDRSFRETIVAGQNDRLARYRKRDLGREIKEAMAPLLS